MVRRSRRGNHSGWIGLLLLATALSVAAPPPKSPPAPPSNPPLPGGQLTVGTPPAAAQSKVEAAEAAARDSTKLAADPSVSAPSSRPQAAPASIYPDVSFARSASTRPAPRPVALPTGLVGDAEVERSIRTGLEVLIGQFDARSHTLRNRRYAGQYEAMECGLDALCVYALMQAGAAVNEPRLKDRTPLIKGMIDALKQLRADRGMHQTYARALRATALSVFNRDEDRAQLQEDVGCLSHGHIDGAYGYLSAIPLRYGYTFRTTAPAWMPTGWGDQSNSQYGLLGVWSGAEAGAVVPAEYWPTVVGHWTKTQTTGGGWVYFASTTVGRDLSSRGPANDQTLSMTAAGTASLLVAGEYAERAAGGFKCGREPFSPALKAAMDWWEQGDHAIRITESKYWGYTLYGIERVGLASGFKFFGENDWFRALARQVIDRQKPDGSWGDLVETSYALLFLSRGRHPLSMNKLRFEGPDQFLTDYWDNRPDDVSFLTRFVSKQIERPLNWQVVPVKRDWTDWLDAPILCIGSHKRPHFRPDEIVKLRQYVEGGGMLFANADSDGFTNTLQAMAAGGGPNEFDQYMPLLAKQLFPDYPLVDLPEDHPLYSSLFKLSERPRLKAVSNGSRLLFVYSPNDLAVKWQLRDEKQDRPAFDFGANLYVYAAGKTDARHRLDTTVIPTPGQGIGQTVKVARLKYGGNWSPEPYAWERFARLFQWKTGTAVDVKTIDLARLEADQVAVAHLSGTAKYDLNGPELSAIREFVNAGGVLLVDDCGGSGAFTGGIIPALSDLFRDAKKTPLTSNLPLLAGGEPGMADNLKMQLRLWSRDKLGRDKPPPIQIWHAGTGAVVFCPLDLTSGMLGLNTWGINGYEPASAEAFVRNVLFWAVDGKK